jgi:hypothetical protein
LVEYRIVGRDVSLPGSSWRPPISIAASGYDLEFQRHHPFGGCAILEIARLTAPKHAVRLRANEFAS